MDRVYDSPKLQKKPSLSEPKKVKAQSPKIREMKEQLVGLLFLGPTIILLGVFVFYPLIKSVYLSLVMTDTLGEIVEFVGIQNYLELFRDPVFFDSLKVTFLFAVFTVPLSIIIALILAVLTHNTLKGMRIFQFFFSLPIAMSVGTSSIIWMLLFHPTSGMINYLLGKFGVDSIQWLTDPNWALVSISLITIWMNLGFNFIILLAGLQGISSELYESAKMDGAGKISLFKNITIPLLSPTLFFVTIISVIGAFQAFGQIHILTKGGPMDSTNVFIYSLYQEAFVNFQFGLGSTRALVLFVIILILTWIQFKVGERKVHYQ